MMDDRSESSDEMEVPPKDNDDCRNAVQDDSEESSLTHGNQVLLSVTEQTFENQQLLSGISPQTSLPSVPTSTSTSQALNSDQLDEIFSSKDVFYSSRKLRIRTKCSRSVDAVLTNLQHLTACNYHSQESGRNITVLENQVLPSLGQETPENQQVETCSRPLVPPILSSSQIQDINQLDEALSNADVFYSSRDLRIRTNCSRNLDALLSPRQNRLGRVDVRLSPRRNLTTSFTPMFEESDVSSDKIDRRDRSPLGECRDTEMASPSELSTVRITRSLSKKLNRKKAPTPTPEKLSVEKDMGPTTAKRRRTESPKSVSGQWKATLESSIPKLTPSAARILDMSPINVQTRETGDVAREDTVPESLRPETLENREIMECSSSDANSTSDAFKSVSSSTLPDLQTQESKEVVPNLVESVTEDITSISSRDYSTDSNIQLKHSIPDDMNLTAIFVDPSREEHEITIRPNVFTDVLSGTSNKDLRKRRETSSDSNARTACRILQEKQTESLERVLEPTDESSSNLEPSYISQIAASEDFQPCMEAETDEFSSASTGETQSASNMGHSATETQILESSQSRPVIENPDIQFPKGLYSGTETRRFITSSTTAFSSSQLPEQSCSADINAPRRDLELVKNKENEGTNQNLSDSSTSTSKQNVKSKPESKEPYSKIREMLLNPRFKKTIKSSDIMDSEVPMQKKYDPVLYRRHFDSNSSEATRSRERSEVGMDLDAPYLDVHEGQPSTSSYQPVIADDSSTGDRFNSSSGVAASGDATGRVIECNTSSNRISKYISNARTLLLTVLEEIMKFNEQQKTYRIFSKLFSHISVLSCYNAERDLFRKLLLYMGESRMTYDERYALTSCPIVERCTLEAYDALTRVVVATLVSTLSIFRSVNFDYMMINYKTLKGLYERCSQFWRDGNEEIQDEGSRNRVAYLKGKIQRLLLQTMNAFRELLVFIGENAESRIIESYEECLWDEDKIFLRRQFV